MIHMCLAIPGKIISIENKTATVDYGSEKRQASIVVGDFFVGDFVVVQGRIVVEKVPLEQVQQWLDLLAEKK
jgi:hydrogenase expression/formation protein HypC